MNKVQRTRILAAGILMMLAANSYVYSEVVVTPDGQRYHVASDGSSVELTYLAYDSTNVKAYQGDLVVPANVGENYIVKGVTPFACVYCNELQSVVLPEGLTRIGFGAFSDCPNLTKVALPSSLVTLNDWSFYCDSSLCEITIPENVTRVGACSFAFCTGLDSLSMPMALRAIGQNAFYYCTSLSRLYIPGTVSQIGEYAFAYNTSLQQITTDGAPVAITPDVFEGLDVTCIRLVVPSDQVEAYKATEVWCDFDIVDGGYSDIKAIEEDDPFAKSFSYRVVGKTLYLTVNGDAPALVYDLQGRRIAVAASHSGETQVPLARAHYIIKCGRESHKINIL